MDLDEYRALATKVDAFFARVHDRHRARMRCGAGCSACCQPGLTVSPVEAEALRTHLHTLPAAERARIAARARRTSDHCVALEDDGRCAVYAARPLVCRTQGVPMRTALPVLSVCPLNFEGVPLESVDADCVLDVATIDTLLAVVNARAAGENRLERVSIGDVLSSAHSG